MYLPVAVRAPDVRALLRWSRRSLILVMRREGRAFPWKKFIGIVLAVLVVIGLMSRILYFHLHSSGSGRSYQ